MLLQQCFKSPFQAILLAMALVVFPTTGYCVATGRADFVIGEVTAIASDGTQRPLAKGATINVGDAINTAAGARAQIRFSDGGFVSLQPGSQFRVDEYQYENKTDGKEKGFFSLLKGGMRAVTGLIGKINRDAYRVATASATVGIRGTAYTATLNDGLLVHVGEGAISLTNNAGTLVVTSGNAAFVADFNTQPALTFQKPATPPAGFLVPIPDTDFSENEQRVEGGGLAGTPLNSGTGYAIATASRSCPDGCAGEVSVDSAVTTNFSSTSQLTQYDGAKGGALGTANVSFSATDGIIGWGRWNGGVTTNNGGNLHPLDLASGDTFHYVTGIATPAADIAAMSNVTATYSLIGGTNPTGDGTQGGLGTLNGGSLTAYFGSSTVDANLQVSFATNSYNVNATNMNIANSTFSGGSATTTGGSCGAGCGTSLTGLFAGTNAARAGLAYKFTDDAAAAGIVAGVAAFTKTSSVSDGGISPNLPQ